jgi:FliI/YscN family ATPase
MIGLEAEIQTLDRIQSMRLTGRVEALRGLTVLVGDLPMPVGSLVRVQSDSGAGRRVGSAGAQANSRSAGLGEVVGFDGAQAIVMMLGSTAGIRAGDRVVGLQAMQTVAVGDKLLGRVIDGLGRPIDGRPAPERTYLRAIDPEPLGPLQRASITDPVYTGVRALDLMTTLGCGQRIGVFAGPGVGKSTLLGDIARQSSSDVSVIALIGERGREVKDFIDHSLGPDGLRRSVVVVATSDESALLRVRAALVACAVAEHFRDEGKNVTLMMDSVTRFAHAQRQIGLSVGEPPATKGYTPSVFAAMARLLERAGVVGGSGGASGGRGGSVTGIYSILVEGDDMTEPVADAARGILDGHIILSRQLAQRGHFPAIDVLDSVSRVAVDVCDEAHVSARQQVVRLLAKYKEVEDLVQIGAYAKGSNPIADVAIRYSEPINELLRQGRGDSVGAAGVKGAFEQARSRMVKLALEAGTAIAQLSNKKG